MDVILDDNKPNWARVSVELFICITGVIVNIVAIVLILFLKEYKKTVIYWYILQLAIADIIFLLTFPFNVDEEIHNSWRFSSGMCKGKETILFLTNYASIFFLVIMSIESYTAGCHKSVKCLQKLRTNSATIIIIAVTWIIAILISVPMMLYSDSFGIEPNCKCGYSFPSPQQRVEQFCIQEGFYPGDGGFYNYCVCDLTKCGSTNLQPTSTDHCMVHLFEVYNYPDYFSNYSNFDITNYETDYDINLPASTIAPYNYNYNNIYGSGDIDFSNVYDSSGLVFSPSNVSTSTGERAGIPPSCHYFLSSSGWKTWLIVNFTVLFILPLLIIAFFNILTIFSRQCSCPSSTGSNSGTSSGAPARGHSNEQKTKITLLCAMLALVFLICWLPQHSVQMAKIVGINSRDDKYCENLSLGVGIVAKMKSLLNPLFYLFFLWKSFLNRVNKRRRNINVSYSARPVQARPEQNVGGKIYKKKQGSVEGGSENTQQNYTHNFLLNNEC